jgi:hypothetical protein
MEHYWCFKTLNPLTGPQRIADTIEFLPHNFEMPALSSTDLATRAAEDLTQALRNPHPSAPFLPPRAQLATDLKQLSTIFEQAARPTQTITTTTNPATLPTAPAIVTPTKPPRVTPALIMAAQAPRVTPLVPPATVADVTNPIISTPLQLANGVFDEASGRTLEYRQLINYPNYKK